jgi:hypothetical protein
MRLLPMVSTLAAAVTGLAVVLSSAPGFAQQGGPGGMVPGFRPPPPAPVKPYKAIKVVPPAPFADPTFEAFRKQLGDAAASKDRAGLGKLVVAQNFFWIQEKDMADKRKSGVDNLAKAIDLNNKDGSGWDVLAGFASEATAAELPDQKGVFCAPADPQIDPKEFEALASATQTDPAEWGYPTKDGTEMRAAAKPDAPVTEKLGLTLLRVLPDSSGPDADAPPAFLHVAAPDGKTGFVASDAIASLGNDQMCYAKDAGAWKIKGFFGGVSQ